MTKRGYKYRFYPTPGQVQVLAQTFGCVRFVYNSVLRWRTDAFFKEQKRVGYNQASARLTDIKKESDTLFLNEVSSVPLQQTLRNQQTAFKNFFEGRAKYPAFKKKRGTQSAQYTTAAFRYRDGQVFIAKCEQPLNVRWSRSLPSAPSSLTVSKDASGRYFVSFLCDFEPTALPVVPRMVGIDLGLKDLFITSEGERIGNPRHTAKYAAQLALAQRRLSKKKLGSANRAKARQKVARIHARISDCRSDGLHKLSRRLIDDNQVVCAETLSVKNMIRNPKLSKAISDAGWGTLVGQLKYKGEWAGRQVVTIDRWYPSSKRCSCCGHTLDVLPLAVRSWTCPSCNTEHDRDVNAAINIKAAGLAVLALGENVSGEGKVPSSCSR
ncbi:RNA-guided endonuclease InsQ/TnpB family protein [Pseudomonas tolaasii]